MTDTAHDEALAQAAILDAPEFYEPWVPQVGQRVRAQISGECPLHAASDAKALDGVDGVIFDDLRSPRTGWHVVDEDGAARHLAAGHWWAVDFRQSGGAITPKGKLVNGDVYCAAELTLLPAPDDGSTAR